jgi:hypothetical protein
LGGLECKEVVDEVDVVVDEEDEEDTTEVDCRVAVSS